VVSISDILANRHLLRRHLRHAVWDRRSAGFARPAAPADHRAPAAAFPFAWVDFSCPIVNHPTQRALLPSKVHNMRIATRRLDGLVVEPGEIVSFWRLIGRPSAARGFASGPTFHRGVITQSAGGGLCQVSGLLYNLAILSGLTILERFPHSIDAYGERRYLPLGRDATVAYVSKDLAFRNDTQTSLRFAFDCSDERTGGTVHGDRPMPFRVTIESLVEADAGDKRTVGTYRTLHEGSASSERQYLGSDCYRMPTGVS
jgi:vancomycin resistance protein VanW